MYRSNKADKFAIIFLQYQNEFLSPKGLFNNALRNNHDFSKMIEKSIFFLNDLRAIKAEIIFVTTEIPEEAFGAHKTSGILKPFFAKKALLEKSWGSAPYAGFDVRSAREIRLDGKNGVSGFKGTKLHEYLQQRGITHLGVAGLLTNCCVDSTLRDGFDLGYQMYSITDCQITFDPEAHKAALKYSHPHFSELVKSEQFITLVHESQGREFLLPDLERRFFNV